jgi:hypothetical protein
MISLTMPFLRIEYAETKNDEFDSSPVLPGFTDDGIFWACVTPLPGGKTRWRRIRVDLIQSSAPRAAVVATAIMLMVGTVPTDDQLRRQIETLLRDEFADLERQVVRRVSERRR